MRNMISINEQDVINNQRINTLTRLGATSIDLIKNNPVFETLAAEDRANFVNYIEWRGLAKLYLKKGILSGTLLKIKRLMDIC